MKKLLSVLFAAALASSCCFAAVPFISQAEGNASEDEGIYGPRAMTMRVFPDYKEYTCGDWLYTFEYTLYGKPVDALTIENGCAITGYKGSDKDIVIPSTLDGNNVVAIGLYAFLDNKDITSVTIPDSVQQVFDEAFCGCKSLTSVDLGNSVSHLYGGCFGSCDSLTSIELPASVTTTGASAASPFMNVFTWDSCDSLKTVTIANGGVQIPAFLFNGCKALEKVSIPEGISTIRKGAFQDCESLKEISLPNSVKTIESGAFYGCNSLKNFYDYNKNTEYGGNVDYYLCIFSDNTVIHGYPDSNAKKYADEHNLVFVSLSETDVTEKQLYRLYNPYSGEHFYTSTSTERDILISVGWKSEGVAWKAPTSSNTPVYRVYNPNSGEHHYTMNAGERDTLVGVGWKDEGIGWYSDESQGSPLYRLYNPNATGQYEAGGHHYTKDPDERANLLLAGWRDEGIGWYGTGYTAPITKVVLKDGWYKPSSNNKGHISDDMKMLYIDTSWLQYDGTTGKEIEVYPKKFYEIPISASCTITTNDATWSHTGPLSKNMINEVNSLWTMVYGIEIKNGEMVNFAMSP